MRSIFKRTVCFFLIALPVLAFSQVKNPVKWSYTAKKLATGKYEVHMTATVEKGWHIYSQTTPEGGPVPTQFTFTKNPLLTISGPVKELGKLETHFEKLFDVNVKQFSDKVDFVQIVTVKGTVKTNLTGKVEYMLCDEKQCLPPASQSFSIALN
jgi:thiol:disulfide interchange protein DsbD